MSVRPQMVIAIDPGAKGAIASYITACELRPGSEELVDSWEVEKLSQTPQDRFLQIKEYADHAGDLEVPRIAVLELVAGFTGVPQPGSRMFTFGQGYGQLEGILVSLGYQIIRVRPQVWQAALSLKTRKGESKPEHKRRMRAKALDLFPQLRPTLDQTDALLILYSHIMNGKLDSIGK